MITFPWNLYSLLRVKFVVFIALRYASAVYAIVMCPTVRPSVCLSVCLSVRLSICLTQAGIITCMRGSTIRSVEANAKVYGRGQFSRLTLPKLLTQFGWRFKYITKSAHWVDVQNLVEIDSAVMNLRFHVDFSFFVRATGHIFVTILMHNSSYDVFPQPLMFLGSGW